VPCQPFRWLPLLLRSAFTDEREIWVTFLLNQGKDIYPGDVQTNNRAKSYP